MGIEINTDYFVNSAWRFVNNIYNVGIACQPHTVNLQKQFLGQLRTPLCWMSATISFFFDLLHRECVGHSAFWAIISVGSTQVWLVLLMYLNWLGINYLTVKYPSSSVSPQKIFLYQCSSENLTFLICLDFGLKL